MQSNQAACCLILHKQLDQAAAEPEKAVSNWCIGGAEYNIALNSSATMSSLDGNETAYGAQLLTDGNSISLQSPGVFADRCL